MPLPGLPSSAEAGGNSTLPSLLIENAIRNTVHRSQSAVGRKQRSQTADGNMCRFSLKGGMPSDFVYTRSWTRITISSQIAMHSNYQYHSILRNALIAISAIFAFGSLSEAEIVFDADFEGSTPGAASSTNLNAGTSIGSWSVGSSADNGNANISEDPSVMDNGAELWPGAGTGYIASFSSAGTLSDGVTVEFDTTMRNGINGGGRDVIIQGVDSGGNEVFRLMANGINGSETLTHVDSGGSQTVIGSLEKNQGAYETDDMRSIRLELTDSMFDIYYEGGATPVIDDADYNTLGVTDLAAINIIGNDGRSAFWLDNVIVENIEAVEPEIVPEPSAVFVWGLIAVGMLIGRRCWRKS
jgi:hypothetical protein